MLSFGADKHTSLADTRQKSDESRRLVAYCDSPTTDALNLPQKLSVKRSCISNRSDFLTLLRPRKTSY